MWSSPSIFLPKYAMVFVLFKLNCSYWSNCFHYTGNATQYNALDHSLTQASHQLLTLFWRVVLFFGGEIGVEGAYGFSLPTCNKSRYLIMLSLKEQRKKLDALIPPSNTTYHYPWMQEMSSQLLRTTPGILSRSATEGALGLWRLNPWKIAKLFVRKVKKSLK